MKIVAFWNVATCRQIKITDVSGRCGSGSVVGIATGYGLEGPGIESRWGRDCPDRPWGPPSLLYNGYRVFPGGKERPGRDADPSPVQVSWSRKSRTIPLLLLWAVRSVQTLSACTRVHFTLFRRGGLVPVPSGPNSLERLKQITRS